MRQDVSFGNATDGLNIRHVVFVTNFSGTLRESGSAATCGVNCFSKLEFHIAQSLFLSISVLADLFSFSKEGKHQHDRGGPCCSAIVYLWS